MIVAEAREKCKGVIANIPRDVFILVILVLASSLSFGFGYLAGSDANKTNDALFETSYPSATSTTKQVVASKFGTKYYLPECAGADRISDANKIWFSSAAAATSEGYTPAANCDGI